MALAFAVFHQEGNKQRRRAAEQARKPIRTHGPLYSFYIHPSHQDSFLYIQFFRTHQSSIHCGGSLITLSKYIHVRSCFEEFIETNLMVQSEFHLDFWFVSYSIFCYIK
jgi:hypothetical protein